MRNRDATPPLAPGPLAALTDELVAAADARARAFNAADTLAEFRRVWASVRIESQMRQSLQEAPDNAGPLNSAALVHRSIGLMREASQGYLQHFLSYVDDLSAVEALVASASAPKDVPRTPAVKKRAKPRSDIK